MLCSAFRCALEQIEPPNPPPRRVVAAAAAAPVGTFFFLPAFSSCAIRQKRFKRFFQQGFYELRLILRCLNGFNFFEEKQLTSVFAELRSN